METSQDSIITTLKSIRALVGSLAFEAAVATLNGEAAVVEAPAVPAPAVPAAVASPEEKPKRTRRLTDEQRDAAKSNMASMQAFIKVKRAALPEGTPHKEVQRQAGEEWRAKTKEEKEAWYKEHLAVPALSAAVSAEAVATETVKVAKVTTPLGPGPTPSTRGRGRPPKEGLPTGRLNVRRLSKTETEETPLPGAAE